MPLGIYQHYKGPLYQVLGLAHDANAEELCAPEDVRRWLDQDRQAGIGMKSLSERTVVVYMPLELDKNHLGARMAVRTLANFNESVCWQFGCVKYGTYAENSGLYRCGHCQTMRYPRFTYRGPVLTQAILDARK